MYNNAPDCRKGLFKPKINFNMGLLAHRFFAFEGEFPSGKRHFHEMNVILH